MKLFAVLAASFASVSNAQTIYDALETVPYFSTLLQGINAADPMIAAELKSDSNTYTAFAPVNSAFDPYASIAECLFAPYNKEILSKLLMNHVVEGEFNSTEVAAEDELTTVGDWTISFTDDIEPILNQTDIQLQNGIVHALNGVLVQSVTPNASYEALTFFETAAQMDDFSFLRFLVEEDFLADIKQLLSVCNATAFEDGLTLFAPTDSAFDEVDEPESEEAIIAILTDHVAVGLIDLQSVDEVTMLSGNVVLKKDIEVSAGPIRTLQGNIYALDSVILTGPNSAGALQSSLAVLLISAFIGLMGSRF